MGARYICRYDRQIKQREVAGGDSAGNTHESHAHTDWAATPWGPFSLEYKSGKVYYLVYSTSVA